MSLIYLAMACDPNISEEQRKQEKAYKKYVDEHRANVKKAWENIKNNKKIMDYVKQETGSIEFFRMQLDSQVQCHDMSKYDLEEWEAYRINHFPVDDQEIEDNKADYDKAWIHHYTVNLHHPDWWSINKKQDSMPFAFVVEMCCDWIAMSMKFGGDAYHWYLENKKEKDLGVKQDEWTRTILKMYYNITE